MNIPKFVWWIIGAVLVLVVLVIFKVDISAGSGGFSISQGLVH